LAYADHSGTRVIADSAQAAHAAERPARRTLRAAFSARYLIGLPVRASNGEHVGTIDDLIVERRNGAVSLSIKTPERTRIVLPWSRSRVDAARNIVYAAIEPRSHASFSRVRLDSTGARGDLRVFLAPLLRAHADVGGIAHSAPLDDVIVSRDGYALALVTSENSADGSARYAYRFPLRFAYDSARRELVVPASKRLQNAVFDYGELGIVPPRHHSGRESAEASANALPVAVPAAAAGETDGCWARLYSAPAFRGNPLTLVGPVAMTRLKQKIGYPWDPAYESVVVGRGATLNLYAKAEYHDKTATFKSGERIGDLDGAMGRFRVVRSAALTCNARE
jgi:hypothetical protein